MLETTKKVHAHIQSENAEQLFSSIANLHAKKKIRHSIPTSLSLVEGFIESDAEDMFRSRSLDFPEPILTSMRTLILPMSLMTTDSDPLAAFMTQHRMAHVFRANRLRVCPTGPRSRTWLWPLFEKHDPAQVMLATLFG